MVLLDVSIVNVALPSIRTGLHAAQSELQWVLSGYALTFGLLLVPAGRIGDLRGRRTVFVVALGLFTLASAACGAAPNAIALVIARLVQGLAGGTLTPQISALIQELFSGRERGKAFGWFGTMVGISTAIGPLLGGLLIAAFGETSGWRWVFFVNVPIGLVAMPLAWRLLPGPGERGAKKRHDLDLVGVGLLGVGAVVLLLPFVQEQEWKGSGKWLLVPAALALLAAFVLWDLRYGRRGREPLVELDLFRLRSYSFGLSMVSVYFAGFTPLFFVFTLYLQTGQHYSALLAGLAITPFAIGSGFAAALGGRIVDRYGRRLVAAGLVLVGVGFIGALVAVHLEPTRATGWATLGPLLVAGFGSGLVISPNQTLTLSQVPVRHAGTAGGLLQTGQRIGSAIGIAAVGSAFFAKLANSRGDYASAFERGVLVALAFIALALVVAAIDLTVNRAAQAHQGGHHRSNPQDQPVSGQRPCTRSRSGRGQPEERAHDAVIDERQQPGAPRTSC
jgi:EmrB/QacA subfamily drug resistance transporter